MTVFPTVFYTSACEVLCLLHTFFLKKVPLSGEASPYSPLYVHSLLPGVSKSYVTGVTFKKPKWNALFWICQFIEDVCDN